MNEEETHNNFDITEASNKFSYRDYEIIGDTAEIDKLVEACGPIFLSWHDVRSTLSNEEANYVITVSGEGEKRLLKAIKVALNQLPLGLNGVSKMLMQMWMPRSNPFIINEIKQLIEFVRELHKDVEFCIGCAYDESLQSQQAGITLLVSGKIH